ncbi:Enniatin synthase [Cytospora mali]|uniref:Enniatin synthase n=1 Tax=Cytospora mali TaxID=578113 RepID=A0A194VD55_CYTMA|nr:Enniatin synthase [Valsa mali var. pyri (nom. inval.)]
MPGVLINTTTYSGKPSWGKSSFTTRLDKTFEPYIFRAAWLALLARYSRADVINVEDTGSSVVVEIGTDPELETRVLLKQVRENMVGDGCFTNGPVNTFPLAERRLKGGNINFRTGIFHNTADDADTSDCHIHVVVSVNSATVSVSEELSSRKHDADLPKRLAGQLQAVAAHLHNAGPDSTIGAINFMGSYDWEDATENDLPYPEVKRDTLHAMMLRNSVPNSPAVQAWDGSMTYAELDQASSVLARKLRRAGVNRGCFVPLFFEKSLWHPVSMFACSKIGAAWVSIPFDMPLGRVESIINTLKDKQGRTSQVCLSSVSEGDKAASFVPTVIQVDAEAVCEDDITSVDSDSIDANSLESDSIVGVSGIEDVEPEDRAYVIFTSGTTGTPKGIAISQQNICSFIPAWVSLRGHPGGPGIRDSQILSYAFDMCLVEALVCLCTGSCLCILSEDERMNDLGPALARYGVTHLHATPSLSEVLNPAELPALKHIHFGGEWITHALVNKWLPKIDVLLTYGPAEITNECGGARVSQEAGFGNGCIGRPFGSRIYITNPDNPHQRLPRGFVGEIIVEGPGVSKGYVANPTQTAKAFVQDLAWAPAVDGRPRRFYRTGDLGYVDADGLFFCRGRGDLQVKIRGQRIELAELESNIKALVPQATRVVADAVTLRGGTKALAAFLQLDATPLAERDGLIGMLKAQLPNKLPPAFMPSAFIIVDSIPLGRTGKADRKTLKEMVGEVSAAELLRIKTLTASAEVRQQSLQEYSHVDAANANTTLEVLRKIWTSVLPCDASEVTPESNFFALGGDSLIAMKMVSLAQKESITLSVREVFKSPTLATLSQAVGGTTTPPAAASKTTPATVATVEISKAEKLRNIWATVLGLSSDDVFDESNFFALGGDSLSAMKLVSLAHKESITFSVSDIFKSLDFQALCDKVDPSGGSKVKIPAPVKKENPVLGAPIPSPPKRAAPAIEALTGEKSDAIKVDIATTWGISEESIEEIAAATPLQESLYALSKINDGVHVLQYDFQIPQDASLQRLRDAWQRVFDRTSILRTRFFQSSTALLQVVLAEDFHWEVRTEMDSEKARLRLRRKMSDNDAHMSDLVVLRAPSGESQTLIWTVHHALTDGYATGLIMDAVKKAYQGHVTPQLESFVSFANSVNEITISEEDKRYWQSVLGGWRGTTFPALPTPGYRVRTNASMSRTVPKFAMRRGARYTTPLILRAAWILTLAKMAGTDDVVFGAVVSGRTDQRSMGVIGPLLTTLPVRVKVNLDLTTTDFLQQVHHEMVAMMAYEQTGMSRIASISPELQRACQFQNILNIKSFRPMSEDAKPDPVEVAWLKPKDGFQDSSTALSVGCFLKPTGIELVAQYDETVINKTVVDEALENFARLVQTLASSAPEITVGSVLSGRETEQTNKAHQVEEVLKTCLPEGLNCAIRTLMPKNGPEVLVAFLDQGSNVSESAFNTLVEQIRHQLAKKLPDSMIPSAFYRMPRSDTVDISLGSIPEQVGLDKSLIEDITPVTPYQKRVIDLMLKTPGFGAFSRQYIIMSDLDIDRLVKAWDLICSALPCMRTRVALDPEDKSPRHVTTSTWASMEIVHHTDSAAAEAYVDNMRISAGTLGLALARAAVVHVPGKPSVFVYSISHAVYDGASLDAIWKALCEAYWTGRITQVLLPYRYLMDHLSSVDMAPAKAFWKQYLHNAPPTVFPMNPTSDHITHVTGRESLVIPLPARRGSPITTSTLVHAAWGFTVGSYKGSKDVVFRGLLSGRTIPVDGIERMSGPVVTYVPIRVRTDDESATLSTFLRKVQEDNAEVLSHETLGLDAISALSPQIANVVNSFNNALVVHPASSSGGGKNLVRPLPLRLESKYMDLTGYVALVLTCRLHADKVAAEILHDPEVLDDKEARGVLARFSGVLGALAAAEKVPGMTVGGLRTFMQYNWEH